MSTAPVARRLTSGRRLHPIPVRVMHWLNALAIVLLIGSGWNIYNGQPLFAAIRFPEPLLLGGDPAVAYKLNGDGGFGGALQWHLAAMWLLVLNTLAYAAYGIATGRFRRMLWPVPPAEVLRQVRDALRFHLDHGDIRVYNAVQKLLYIGVMAAILVQILAGLALWKPVQFSPLLSLFVDFQGARLAHFLGMGAIVGFLVVHVALALIVPKTIVAMVTGGPEVDGPTVDDPAASTPDAPAALAARAGA